MNALPIIFAVLVALACFALVGALLCRDRSISGICQRLNFDQGLYARALLIAGAPIGLLGWLASRYAFTGAQETGLILTVFSTIIYAAVPVFILRGLMEKRTAAKVVG